MAQNSDSTAPPKSPGMSMRERITGLLETVTVSNVQLVADQISSENLTLGRGLFCKAIMDSQSRSPESSNLYASLAAAINSRFPDAGHLLVRRVVLQFRRAHVSGDGEKLRGASRFLAHLVNQRVAYDALALDALSLLLARPTSDSVEVAAGLCLECGELLLGVAPRRLREVLAEFRRVRGSGALEEGAEGMVAKLFAARRGRFRGNPRVVEELDIVEDGDGVTHGVGLMEDHDPESYLDEFVGRRRC